MAGNGRQGNTAGKAMNRALTKAMNSFEQQARQ